jgi:ketosteroid isomerase-like protein
MNRVFCVLSAMAAVVLSSLGACAQKTASAPVGVTSAASPEIAVFQKIEDAWAGAVNQRDQYALELVLSPLFVDVSATGEITTRNQQLVQVMDIEDKTLHLEQKVITVRQIGEIAVANGTYVLHHKAGSGTLDQKGIFTHVFERGRSGWLCINSQRTVLREDATGKQKKPSNAEMPFHIPLFSKGEKNN